MQGEMSTNLSFSTLIIWPFLCWWILWGRGSIRSFI